MTTNTWYEGNYFSDVLHQPGAMSLWENDVILIVCTYEIMAELILILLIMSILKVSTEGWKNIFMYEAWRAACNLSLLKQMDFSQFSVAGQAKFILTMVRGKRAV